MGMTSTSRGWWVHYHFTGLNSVWWCQVPSLLQESSKPIPPLVCSNGKYCCYQQFYRFLFNVTQEGQRLSVICILTLRTMIMTKLYLMVIWRLVLLSCCSHSYSSIVEQEGFLPAGLFPRIIGNVSDVSITASLLCWMLEFLWKTVKWAQQTQGREFSDWILTNTHAHLYFGEDEFTMDLQEVSILSRLFPYFTSHYSSLEYQLYYVNNSQWVSYSSVAQGTVITRVTHGVPNIIDIDVDDCEGLHKRLSWRWFTLNSLSQVVWLNIVDMLQIGWWLLDWLSTFDVLLLSCVVCWYVL